MQFEFLWPGRGTVRSDEVASGHGETAETLTQGPGAWQKFDTAAKRPENLTQEAGGGLEPAQNLTQGGAPGPAEI